jgi:hypothetical protein
MNGFKMSKSSGSMRQNLRFAWLFYTHLFRVFGGLLQSMNATAWKYMAAGFSGCTANRVQWFTSVKAVINTIMVLTGFKRPPRFKLTPKTKKLGEATHELPGMSVPLGAPTECVSDPKSRHSWWLPGKKQRAQDKASMALPVAKPVKQEYSVVHKYLSKVTETRKSCMPQDGTLDVWMILVIFMMNLFPMLDGIRFLYRKGALVSWGPNLESVIWLGVIWAAVEIAPGALFLACAPLLHSSFFVASATCLTL